MSKVKFTRALNKQVKDLAKSGKSHQEIADATGLKTYQVYYSLRGRFRQVKKRKLAQLAPVKRKGRDESALMDLLAELVASRIEERVTKAIIGRLT